MKKISYTPGPWFVKENMPHGGGIGIGPDYDDSGDSPHAIITFNGGESEANARLIAAAPEMLEAISAVVSAIENGTPAIRLTLDAILSVLSRPLKKALGE